VVQLRSIVLGVAVAVAGAAVAVPTGVVTTGAAGAAPQDPIRFATFNASLNRNEAGQLRSDLLEPFDPAAPPGTLKDRRQQAANVAEIIQRVRPEVLLINEFDFDVGAARLFQANYLSIGQSGAEPIRYPYGFIAPSNTGIPSGFDLNDNGSVGDPDDAFGFGFFPGQFGMLVLSQHPIRMGEVRTFQMFLWKDMPGHLIPTDFYDAAEVAVLRLSSKSHWDLPIEIGGQVVHFLVSHPTPPVFDGPEDRNGRRNHDEIRFWADYVQPGRRSRYIYDDRGVTGGLASGARFVIAGDQNADPLDGDSVAGAADLLLDSPFIDDGFVPTSEGGPEAAALQGGANATHRGDPRFDTADFADVSSTAPPPGNLRVDYVLPSKRGLKAVDGLVFWPRRSDPLFRLTGEFTPSLPGGFPSSDHRLVALDVLVR
jgi:hypothetical protein